VIEMLAQHLITKPVFDTLFAESKFTEENPVSIAMELVLEQLQQHNLDSESGSLSKFYESVKRRVADVKTADGRQQLVVELYGTFFRTAFPKLTQRLGIVYTPLEVVDFIIHSTNDVLKEEFGKTIGSEGVHILDPFVGTGTFITRLLQSGVIKKEQLKAKFENEIHANEIVLLAYYIAAVNIESIYQERSGNEKYKPFSGLVLTDTFHLYEQDRDLIAELFTDNSDRRTNQKELDVRVVMGNPPYSSGQTSGNDDAANTSYPHLEESIERTYAADSKAANKNSLYDSYIKAFRWASERIGDEGVVSFVTGAGWLDGTGMDGMRKCLAEEFSKLYIFHLRGNQRTQGETSRKEGGKIFGSGSRSPIAISILVKNPKSSQKGEIFFHDIGDYLDRSQKLGIIKNFKSVNGISENNLWKKIIPDEDNNWINQGDRQFNKFIQIGNKKDEAASTIFKIYSCGLKTNRDSWTYNFSKQKLSENIHTLIDNYNQEVSKKRDNKNYKENNDPSYVKWDDDLRTRLNKLEQGEFAQSSIYLSHYRPFQKQWVYFNRHFNARVYQQPKIFPISDTKNRCICVTGVGASKSFSALMTDSLPNLHLMDSGQCFPLKTFEKNTIEGGLFDNSENEDEYIERDGISNEGFAHFQAAYKGASFNKEDLFYYIYGILHSPEYKERFQNNLAKALPRIPAVKKFDAFMEFSLAGRELADLHVGFEDVEPYPFKQQGELRLIHDIPKNLYAVKKMKFAGKMRDKDKSRLIYNNNFTIEVPLEAYDYVVNGRPALEWVMDRQMVSVDKDSGIRNDPNDYANETMNDPEYPLTLFRKVIRVSLDTMRIVKGLPALEI